MLDLLACCCHLATPCPAIKASTTVQANRGFAFALFYAFMNVAALSVGVVLDFFRISIRHGMRIKGLPSDSLLNNGLRLFLFTGTQSISICSCAC